MIRLLIYVVIVLVLGFGFAWLADRPGDMVITWQGQRIELSLMVGVTAVVSLIALIMFSWWLIRSVVASPQIVTRYFRARKRDRGYQALSTGLIAAGAGDAATARKMAQRSMGLLSADQEPLIHLLDAQTAMIEGKNDEARTKFEAMVEDPETRDLGLRGLYLEARRLGAVEAAQHYAEQAAEQAPHLPWAAEAALGFRSADGAWDDAIRLLEKQRMARVLDKAAADRKKSVLLTARAMEKLEKGDVSGARTDGVEANRLAPDLVPAALIAARALFRENNLRKGSRILEKSWKSKPHPDVAEAYVRARPGDSTHDRLKRAQKLEGMKSNHRESLHAVAQAALDALEFKLAREKAEAASRLGARESIYLLLADIEEADTGDQGRVRHWLAQAVRAPRDEAWTADGYVAEHWAPVSPVTGKLDAFEWKIPVEQISGPVEDGEAVRASAERAIESLPPVAVAVVVEDTIEVAAPVDLIVDAPLDEKTAVPDRPIPNDTPVSDAPVEAAKPEPKAEKNAAIEGEVLAPDADVAAKTEEVISSDTPAKKPTDDGDEASATPEGETHIVTDAVDEKKDKEREAAFLSKPLDDPGVDENVTEDEPKSRFRLF